MNTKKILSAAALAAVVSMAAQSAQAANAGTEKCYGVVKAGKNDCKTGAHACASHGSMASSGEEFIVLPAGLCAKLEKGSLKPVMMEDDGMMKKPMGDLNK